MEKCQAIDKDELIIGQVQKEDIRKFFKEEPQKENGLIWYYNLEVGIKSLRFIALR